jgi:copper chaperone
MNVKRAVATLAALAIGFAAAGAIAADTAKTTLAIEGMTCAGCVAAVKHQLGKTDGVTEYDVSLEDAEAVVSYDPSRVDPEQIAASVSKTGFEASVKGEEEAQKSH